MINIQHISMNNMGQLAKLSMSTGATGGLAQEGHNLIYCKVASVKKA